MTDPYIAIPIQPSTENAKTGRDIIEKADRYLQDQLLIEIKTYSGQQLAEMHRQE